MDRNNDLPKEGQWNNFWEKDNAKKFHSESWSKKRIKGILSKYDLRGKNVLDAGCGSGFFSKYFCDEEAVTYSLDYSSEALRICENLTKKRTTILKKDLLNDNIPADITQRFDLIFSDGLFEHFLPADQDRIMGNLKGLLSEDGNIATFVPNRFSPWELIRPFYMPGIKEDPFILKGLVELNLRNNLRVVEKGGINTMPFSFSPDKMFGNLFGMLLFTLSKKNKVLS